MAVNEVLRRLIAVFVGLAEDVRVIQTRGQFSSDCGDWRLNQREDGAVEGEGPAGFSGRLYERVIQVTSVERFGAIEHTDSEVRWPLRRVFEGLARALGTGSELAVASGGYGDPDRANDLAIAGAEFTEVCKCLEEVAGAPARSWEALEADGGYNWYRRTAADRDGAPDRRPTT